MELWQPCRRRGQGEGEGEQQQQPYCRSRSRRSAIIAKRSQRRVDEAR
jgi:hypothetical protein